MHIYCVVYVCVQACAYTHTRTRACACVCTYTANPVTVYWNTQQKYNCVETLEINVSTVNKSITKGGCAALFQLIFVLQILMEGYFSLGDTIFEFGHPFIH